MSFKIKKKWHTIEHVIAKNKQQTGKVFDTNMTKTW